MNTTVMGIATALNIIVVVWKIRNDRVIDGIIDGTLLALTIYVLMDTLGGLQMGTIGSAMVSIYLLFDPIRIDISEEIKTVKYALLYPFIQIAELCKSIYYLILYPFVFIADRVIRLGNTLSRKRKAKPSYSR